MIRDFADCCASVRKITSGATTGPASIARRQETAALRDLSPVYVRYGSSAAGRYASGGRVMSASPPKADIPFSLSE